ncbi:MAG: GFA family protein [Caulobacteraceae bacterium]
MTPRTGGCLCGAVRYEISADPMGRVACHCRACQYASGGSPTLAMVLPKAALKVTQGEPRVYWSKGDSGGEVGRYFCEVCATPLFSYPSAAEIAVVRVGSLDDPSDFAVQADMWMSAAQPWHRPHDGAAQMAGSFAAG